MPTETSEQQIEEKRSLFSIGGAFGGFVFGGFAIGISYVKLSTVDLNFTSILSLLFAWLACVVVGGFLGEKIVNKIADWLHHFI